MMKKLNYFMMILTLTLLFLGSLISYSAANEKETMIIISDVCIPIDGTATTKLQIMDVANMGSFHINVSWDPNVITAVSIDNGLFDICVHYIYEEEGRLSIAGASYDSLTENTYDCCIIEYQPAIGATVGMATTLHIEYSEIMTAEPQAQDIFHYFIDGVAYIISSNIEPIANFTWNPSNPSTNDPVQFTDTSIDPGKGIVEWNWNFGDGDSSNDQNPSHLFMDDGNYSVCLTVKDNEDATDTICKMVHIDNVGPIANYSYDPIDPMTDDAIYFIDESVDTDGFIANWLWDFGDDNNSNEQHPIHQYEQALAYSVCLTVWDDDGKTNMTCKEIKVIGIDVNQSNYNRGFPIRHTWDGEWGAAQNFTATLNTLTSAEIYLRKFGTPEFNLTVELRMNHPEGTLLDTLTFTPEELLSSWQWLTLNFNDITFDPDTNIFIVLPPAPSTVSTSYGYEWGYSFGDQYQPGSFWFTRDGGILWRDLPTMYEFVFRTYGYN